MTKKVRGPKDKKKVSGVQVTDETNSIERSAAIGGVDHVQRTGGVTGVRRASSIGGSKNVGAITSSNRSALQAMVDEVAEDLFRKSSLSSEQRKVIKEAVKMTISAAATDQDEEEPS